MENSITMSVHQFQYNLEKLLKTYSHVEISCTQCPPENRKIPLHQLRKHVSTVHNIQCHRSCHFCFGNCTWSRGDVKNSTKVSEHRLQCATQLLNMCLPTQQDSNNEEESDVYDMSVDDDEEEKDQRKLKTEPTNSRSVLFWQEQEKISRRRWKRINKELNLAEKYDKEQLIKLQVSEERERDLNFQLNASKEREKNLQLQLEKKISTEGKEEEENLFTQLEPTPMEEREKDLLSQLEASQQHGSELREQLKAVQSNEETLRVQLKAAQDKEQALLTEIKLANTNLQSSLQHASDLEEQLKTSNDRFEKMKKECEELKKKCMEEPYEEEIGRKKKRLRQEQRRVLEKSMWK